MTEISPGYRLISVEEAEKSFDVSTDVECPFQDFAGKQEIRLYEEDLHVPAHLTAVPGGEPYSLIVHGDLTVDGDLDWWDASGGNFLLVTGGVRARNVLLSGCPNVVVRGDLVVDGGIQGHHGDNGGFLKVGGHVRAQVIVNTLHFSMEFAGQPEGVVAADPYRTTCAVDFTDQELGGVLLPDLLDAGGAADQRKIGDALRAGRQVLRTGARPSHVATMDELDALSARADEVTELDLSDRKLRRLPEQLFAFPNLRVLSLSGNDDIGGLDERIGELTSLEELSLCRMGLTELPEAIGRLRNLRVLDISANQLEALPEQIGDLAGLEVLRAGNLTCPVPDALARLDGLRELCLSELQPGEWNSPVDFPLPVTRLSGLRSLDLSLVWLTAVPDELLELTTLETLDLRGSLSAGLERLPDLGRLPNLRVLRLSGNTPWTFQPEPSRDLLTGVWAITTLEELELDRWNETLNGEHAARTAFTALPDDAFARMPGLRRLDLSFNELADLPESFFELERLDFVDLRYTNIGGPAVERLRETFPHVRVAMGRANQAHLVADRDRVPDDLAELVDAAEFEWWQREQQPAEQPM